MKKAEATRNTILVKAFELIYANGYHATSIDDIIAQTNVTKGAFFYHFKNKEDMGLAMINEVMYKGMYESMIANLQHSENPINDLYKLFEGLLLGNPVLRIQYGCPANNLIQELASVNPAFNASFVKLTDELQAATEEAVKKAKKLGLVRSEINPKQVAFFIWSGYGGIRNLGKVYQTTDTYKVYLKELKRYFKSLQ